jgi:hypothetical protein
MITTATEARTPDFGTIIDYWTGVPIRSATRLEWLRSTTVSADIVVISADGRDVIVRGGPEW